MKLLRYNVDNVRKFAPAMFAHPGAWSNPIRRSGMSILTHKKCSKCFVIKKADEFYKARGKSTGLFSRCKECDKKVYAQKRDGILAYHKEYYKKNRETIIEKSRRYYNDLKTNRHDELLESRRKYQKTPKGRELARIQLNRRRAREKGVVHDLTTKDVKQIMLSQGGKCLSCGIDLSSGYHIDHILPLSKGGGLTFDNVQLLCPLCNQRKANKTIDYRRKDIS